MVCQQVAAIPTKRVPPPETRFLERDEIQQLLQEPAQPRTARTARPRADPVPLQHRRPRPRSRRPPRRASRPATSTRPSACTARATNGEPAHSGRQTARIVEQLLAVREPIATAANDRGVHRPRPAAHPLRHLQDRPPPRRPISTTPEPADGSARTPSGTPPPSTCSRPASRSTSSAAGSGHADLTTTNRYAEINTKAKQEALLANRTSRCFGGTPHQPNLAHGRDPAELARIALTVMCPTVTKTTPPITVITGRVTRSAT